MNMFSGTSYGIPQKCNLTGFHTTIPLANSGNGQGIKGNFPKV